MKSNAAPVALLIALLTPALLISAAPAQLPQSLKIPDSFGINIHFTNDAQPGELDLLAATGARWVRADMTWSICEHQPGQYDFRPWDTLLDQCDRHGIRVLMVMAYTNPLYDNNESPHTDAGVAAFANWVAAAAVHFHGRHVLWECYNEPNNSFWRPAPDPAAYIKLALATGKALKAAAPDELYVGPALSGTDGAWMEACYKSGLLNFWDAVTVHPYGNAPPEERERHWRGSKSLLDRYRPKSKPLPLLSGEWGYTATNISEESQANMLPRMLLLNLSQGIPLTIWYDWRDDGPDPNNPENRFGLVRNPYHKNTTPVLDPKPAYNEAKRLTTELANYEFDHRLNTANPDDYLLLFRNAAHHKLAAWTTAQPHDITLPDVGKLHLTEKVTYLPTPD